MLIKHNDSLPEDSEESSDSDMAYALEKCWFFWQKKLFILAYDCLIASLSHLIVEKQARFYLKANKRNIEKKELQIILERTVFPPFF